MTDKDTVIETGKNTEITYMYRDGSNYKQNEDVVIPGRIELEDIRSIEKSLFEGEYFIPSAVGLEDLQERNIDGWNADDHPYHEFTGIQYTNKEPTINIIPSEFVERFLSANWEEEGQKITESYKR